MLPRTDLSGMQLLSLFYQFSNFSRYFYRNIHLRMKTKVMLKYIFPLAFLFAACSSVDDSATKDSKKDEIVQSFENESDMDNRIVEIDALVGTSEKLVSSMKYQKSDGSFVQVIGYMNRDNQILKIEELFSDGSGKSQGQRIYYLNGGKPFVTQELIDEILPDNNGSFIDRVTYYNAKGKVLKTKERRSAYQEDTEVMAYKPVSLHGITIDRAMRALNSEKEFASTFQGLVFDGGATYLVVGENSKNDPYTAALRCDYKDPLILELSSDPDSFLGRKLKVNFEIKNDNNFEYMVYAGGDFAD